MKKCTAKDEVSPKLNGETSGPDAEKERREKFNALITGEFKDLYDESIEKKLSEINSGEQKPARELICEKASRRYEKWLGEARDARKLYPGFDLGREIKNEQFCELLKSGVPVKAAYELIHRDELMSEYAKEIEESITKRILAGTLRPMESAINAPSAAAVKCDTSRMSKNARQEIIRRVQSGEKISF